MLGLHKKPRKAVYIRFAVLIISVIALLFVFWRFERIIYNKEVVVIYPQSTESKIKPLKGKKIMSESIITVVKSQGKNNQKLPILQDVEQPIAIDNNFDPFDVIFNNSSEANNLESLLPSSHYKLTVIPASKLESINSYSGKNNPLIKHQYYLQLATRQSQAEAITLLEKIKTNNAILLKDVESKVISSIIANKILYKVVIDGYDHLQKANLLCKKLISLPEECIIIDVTKQ